MFSIKASSVSCSMRTKSGTPSPFFTSILAVKCFCADYALPQIVLAQPGGGNTFPFKLSRSTNSTHATSLCCVLELFAVRCHRFCGILASNAKRRRGWKTAWVKEVHSGHSKGPHAYPFTKGQKNSGSHGGSTFLTDCSWEWVGNERMKKKQKTRKRRNNAENLYLRRN